MSAPLGDPELEAGENQYMYRFVVDMGMGTLLQKSHLRTSYEVHLWRCLPGVAGTTGPYGAGKAGAFCCIV